MPAAIPTDRLLRDIVELRLAARATRDPLARERIRSVESGLRRALGPGVPKKRAADALGVSMTALDKWVDRGVLPVVTRRGSSRLQLETGPLLDLLEQVAELRANGVDHRILTAAVKRLGWRDDPDGRDVLSEEVAALPRPNVPRHELREYFERTTAQERVEEMAGLSGAITAIAVAARRRR